jgi:hypothetical protein
MPMKVCRPASPAANVSSAGRVAVLSVREEQAAANPPDQAEAGGHSVVRSVREG